MKTIFSCVFPLFVMTILLSCNNEAGTASNQKDSITEVKTDTMVYGEMKKYWLVFLKKGPNRNQDSTARARIQERHLANIDRLAKEKIIIMAGPMGYSTPSDLQGIFIMDAKDSATAAGYVQTDTAVVTGRLKFEIHPWWTAQGKYNFN